MKYILRVTFFCVAGLLFYKCCPAQSQVYKQKKAEQLAGPSPFSNEIAGNLPQRVIYRDSIVLVLGGLPAAAQEPVHLLLIPAKRILSLNEATDSDGVILGHMLLIAKKMARENGINESGYRIVINTNEDAGQSAFHLHMHLLGGTATGPMVDQAWRNVQKAKTAFTNKEFLTPTTKDSLLMRLMGKWQYINMHDGLETNIILQWEPELHFQFIKESYSETVKDESGKVVQFHEGTASFRGGSKKYRGEWRDSDGNAEEITGSGTINSFTTLRVIEKSKTVYTFLADNSLELINYKEGINNLWQQVNSIVLKRVY